MILEVQRRHGGHRRNEALPRRLPVAAAARRQLRDADPPLRASSASAADAIGLETLVRRAHGPKVPE